MKGRKGDGQRGQDREADAKRNKSDRERQILYDLTWMRNQNKNKIKLRTIWWLPEARGGE